MAAIPFLLRPGSGPRMPMLESSDAAWRPTATEKKLFTADELMRLPRGRNRHELVRGELRTMPPASEEHGIVAAEVLGLVRDHVERTG